MRALEINASWTSKIWRRLQDVCSVDLQIRLFILFGGPGNVVRCDDSKLNHKPKMKVKNTVVLIRHDIKRNCSVDMIKKVLNK